MRKGDLGIVHHRDRLLEVASQYFWHDPLAQHALHQQAGELVPVPFRERDLVGAVSPNVTLDVAAHLFLHVAAEDHADDDLQVLVALGDAMLDVIVQDRVERGTE